MPTVGKGTASRTFSYSDKGERQAAAFAKKTGQKETMKKGAMSASTAAKQARAGKDMGAPGKNFAKIAASAGKEYGSAAAGKRVAGSIFQAKRKAGTL